MIRGSPLAHGGASILAVLFDGADSWKLPDPSPAGDPSREQSLAQFT